MKERSEEKNLKFIKGSEGKPGYYLTDVTLNYVRVRRFAGYTKEEARTYLAELRIAARAGKLAEKIRPQKPAGNTFGEYARALLDSATWKQKRSAARDETSLKALNRKFKTVALVDIRPNVVRDYMTERIKSGLKPASVNRERSLLVSILNAAVGDGLIGSNPIGQKGVKRLEEQNSREEKILELGLTDEDMRRLIASTAPRTRPVIEIALLTGMRLSEILSLRWSQISFPGRRLTIPVTNSKSKKERTIPLGRDLLDVLQGIERRNDYVFPNGKTHVKSIRKSFEAACAEAEIPHGRENGIVFHDLRHVAASQLVRVIDVVTASRILGHSSIEMTMRYVHPTDSDKRAALEALGEWLRGRQKDVNALQGNSGRTLPERAVDPRLIN
jgi:integrase